MPQAQVQPGGARGGRHEQSIVAYAAPMVVFGVLTAVEAYVARSAYPFVYAFKIAAVTATLVWFTAPHRDIRPSWSAVPPGVAIGIVVYAVWVLVDRWVAYPHLGSRVGYNPFVSIPSDAVRAMFLLTRFYGLVLIVPLMEELFWRSFVLRFATREEFAAVQVGDYSTRAFLIMVALFAGTHPEWLAAAVAAALFAWPVGRTRSVFASVVAHSVANGALGVHILLTGQWHYW